MLMYKVVGRELGATFFTGEELHIEIRSRPDRILREGVSEFEIVIGSDVDRDGVEVSLLMFLVAEEALETLVTVDAEICFGRRGSRKEGVASTAAPARLTVFHGEGKVWIRNALEVNGAITSGDVGYGRTLCLDLQLFFSIHMKWTEKKSGLFIF